MSPGSQRRVPGRRQTDQDGLDPVQNDKTKKHEQPATRTYEPEQFPMARAAAIADLLLPSRPAAPAEALRAAVPAATLIHDPLCRPGHWRGRRCGTGRLQHAGQPTVSPARTCTGAG